MRGCLRDLLARLDAIRDANRPAPVGGAGRHGRTLPDWKNPAGSKSEPAGAGGSNRLGGGRGQFLVPHAVEYPFHYGDNLRGCRGESGLIGSGDQITIDACPGQHGGRVGQLIGQPGRADRLLSVFVSDQSTRVACISQNGAYARPFVSHGSINRNPSTKGLICSALSGLRAISMSKDSMVRLT